MAQLTEQLVALPDLHIPDHDPAALSCALQFIEIVKPRIVVQVGDLGDWGGASKYRYKHRKRPPLEYVLPEIDADIAAVNAVLDRIDATCSKAGVRRKCITQGNHDSWMDNLAEEFPYLRGYRFTEAIRAKERGWEVTAPHKHLVVRGLHFHHGDAYNGKYHAASHQAHLPGVDIIYGHHHGLQVHASNGYDRESTSYCLGCLRTLDRERAVWMGARGDNWTHNVALVSFYGAKKYTVNILQIRDGRMFLGSREIIGAAT